MFIFDTHIVHRMHALHRSGRSTRSMVIQENGDTVAPDTGWDFSVYPNPASHDLFLRFSDDAPKRIEVLEPSGREVRSWSQVSGFSRQLTLGDLAHGVYWIQVSTITGSLTKKLIIQ